MPRIIYDNHRGTFTSRPGRLWTTGTICKSLVPGCDAASGRKPSRIISIATCHNALLQFIGWYKRALFGVALLQEAITETRSPLPTSRFMVSLRMADDPGVDHDKRFPLLIPDRNQKSLIWHELINCLQQVPALVVRDSIGPANRSVSDVEGCFAKAVARLLSYGTRKLPASQRSTRLPERSPRTTPIAKMATGTARRRSSHRATPKC